MVGAKLDLQRRQHRERGQPLHRKRLGLLEKHRDYVARARDYHGKQDRIRSLKRKASERNPDEFYHGMTRSETKRGVHVQSRGNEALPTDLVKLLKTQDVKYVRSQRMSEERKLAKLREQYRSQVDEAESEAMIADEDADMFDDAPIAGPSKPKRTVFTDSVETLRSADPLETLVKPVNKGKQRATVDDPAAVSRSTHRAALKAEIAAREQRNLALARAERELDLQRLLMSRGAKKGIVKRQRDPDELESEDEGELEGPKKARLRMPKPMQDSGIKTGARVWKWTAERRR